MDDPELSEILQAWKAPDAPPTLRDRVLPRRQPWSSTPVEIPQVPQAPPVTLADFRPVARLEPKIVGEQ